MVHSIEVLDDPLKLMALATVTCTDFEEMVLPASWEAHIKILGFCDEDRHCSCSLFRINFLTHAGPLNQEYMYSQLLSFFY